VPTQPGVKLGTDFTVAEELHRRQSPMANELVSASFDNTNAQQLANSQDFGSPQRND